MAYDGKILSRARTSLEEIRKANSDEHARRVRQIYSGIPEIEQIDAELSNQYKILARITFSAGKDRDEKIAELKDRNLTLQMRRAELLTENGYSSEYLDEIYACPECRDTGVTPRGMCSCLKKLYKSELSRELSPLLRNGSESFENFDLNLYSSEYSSVYGCVPREYMKIIFDSCRAFALAFPDSRASLLFRGGAGLGKTYLSGCIARAVSDRGYSVCYDSASSAFDTFERRKFAKDPAEQEAAAARAERMLACDLMILDDLGTEIVTPASSSAFYTLLNTRINTGKRMIISTNLTPEELEARYSEAICSRISGEFLSLRFCGDDIRRILKARR